MVNFLNINFLFNKSEVEKKMEDYIVNQDVTYICAVNANIVTVANNNPEYQKIINTSGFNICDGSLVALSYSKIHKEPVSSYPGPDIFIDYLSKKKYKSFFLGSTEETLTTLKKNLSKIDPKIQDMPFYSPPFIALDDFDYKGIGEMINESNADIIWVSLGAPKQEEFMYRLKQYLKKGVMVGVGAAFTFYGSEKPQRAPVIYRKLNIEWLHRIVTTRSFPKRFQRQLYYMPQLLLKDYFRKLSK